MPTRRRRRARFIAALVLCAVLLGLVYGLLTAALGEAAALLTWWGTLLRGLVAVGLCFAVAGAVDRRWSRPR